MRVRVRRLQAYGVAAAIAIPLSVPQAFVAQDPPTTGFCGYSGEEHIFVVGPGSNIGGYSHGPTAPGNCPGHPSIHDPE